MKKTLTLYKVDTTTRLLIPYAESGIKAGFPSPAQDYIELSIDLNRELIKHPSSTFFACVSGDSMVNANLEDGDILVIDKSLKAKSGDMAVCCIDGEFTVKYIRIEKDVIWLEAANTLYPSIKVTEENNFIIWGIVTYIIKKAQRKK